MSSNHKLPTFAATLFIATLWLLETDATSGDGKETDGNKTSLYFSLFVSSAPTLNTSGVVSAVDETLELIQNDLTILPSYSLQYSQVLDAQCNGTRAQELFDIEITSNKTVLAVIGCGCSVATERVLRGSDIPMISYASTSAALSNSSLYPNLFRTVPSDEPLAPALAILMQYYGWRQLSILTEKEQQFTELLQLLESYLSAASITVENSIQFSQANLSETADIVLAGTSRIIFLNANPKSAIFYLCRAFLEEKYYPGYIWITPGWYQDEWWKSDEDYLRSLNCTSSDIEQQLNRSLVLQVHPNTSTINISETFNFNSYATDAVMALALALNTTYENPSLNLSLLEAFETVTFSGASGAVSFNANGNRLNPLVLLLQFRMDANGSTTSYPIATIDQDTVNYVNGETNSTVWPDVRGEVPPVVTVINVVKTAVYAYVATLVAIGVMLSLLCLVFIIVYRKRKVVKLTSPNLNYVIVFGAIMLQIGNLLLPFPSRNLTLIAVFCTMARIFLSIGYDICFVVALVKTIRVAYIFRNVTPNKKKVKDWHLLLLSAGIVLIEVIFTIPLLTLTYVEGDTRLARDSENPTFINEQGYTITHLIISCGLSTTYIIYFSLALAYKVIIHVIGLVLAFITRKVKIDPLNDSKYSAAIIYCSCVMLVLAVIVVFALSGVNTYAGVWSSFVFIEVCIFLGLTFIPKMVSLYRDPKGENIFVGPQSHSQSYAVKSLSTITTEVGKDD